MQFCPECGARLDGKRDEPFRHDVFNDTAWEVCGRSLSRSQWIVLLKLRERYQRFITIDQFVDSLPHRKDELDRIDDERAIRTHIARVRQACETSPFRVVCDWGSKRYGLFPAELTCTRLTANDRYKIVSLK